MNVNNIEYIVDYTRGPTKIVYATGIVVEIMNNPNTFGRTSCMKSRHATVNDITPLQLAGKPEWLINHIVHNGFGNICSPVCPFHDGCDYNCFYFRNHFRRGGSL